MNIIKSQIRDLPDLTRCHRKAFPYSLSSLQGDRFCKKMLEWYIVSDRGILFHIVENEKVVGYCSGIITKFPGLPGAITSISQYAFYEFIYAFIKKPWLLFHSENLKKRKTIISNVRLKFLKKKDYNDHHKQRSHFSTYYGLVGIGVLPDCQGKGYGSLMLKEFEVMARQANVDLIQLSVKRSNNIAIQTYLKNNWEVANNNGDSILMQKVLK